MGSAGSDGRDNRIKGKRISATREGAEKVKSS